MPEPITLGLAKSASDIFKEAMSFARNAKNSALAEKLVDLYSEFVGLLDTNQQLRNEIQQLKNEISELQKRPQIAAKLRHAVKTGSYYLTKEDEKEEGPFCSVCWDVDGRLVRQSMVGMHTICQYCVTARGGKR